MATLYKMCRFTACALAFAAPSLIARADTRPATPAEAWQAGWPSYRGPLDNCAAITTGTTLLADPSKATLLWKSEAQDLYRAKAWSAHGHGAKDHPGGGGCSPIIWGGAVYQVTYRAAGSVVGKAGRGFDSAPAQVFRVEADDLVHSFDLATGKTRWVRAFPRLGANWQSGKSCLPDNNTPAIVGDTLVMVGSTYRMYGLDAATGETRWERGPDGRFEDMELTKARGLLTRSNVTAHLHGTGLSYLQPVGSDLVLLNDQAKSLLAIEVKDGRLRWELDLRREGITSYHLPTIWKHQGRDWLLLSTGKGLRCVDPATSKTRWTLDGLPPQSHLTLIGDRLIAWATGAVADKDNPLGQRAGIWGAPACFELSADGAREIWRRADLLTDGAKWAFPLSGGLVGKFDRKDVGGKSELTLRVLDPATGKDRAVLPCPARLGGRNGFGIAAEDAVILEEDMSHATHDFMSVLPLSTQPAWSDWWTPPHATTTAYDSYMVKPMIAGRRVMRGAFGLFCYDWRATPADDGLFRPPPLPVWAAELPEPLKNLAHPFATERRKAATALANAKPSPDAPVLQLFDRGDCQVREAVADAVAAWAGKASSLGEGLAQRVKPLVIAGKGESACALVRAALAADPAQARRLATDLADAMADPRNAVRQAACKAACGIGRLEPGILADALTKLLSDQEPATAWLAARTLGATADDCPAAATALGKGVGSPNVLTSLACADALRQIALRGKADRTALVSALPRPQPRMPDALVTAASLVADRCGAPGRDYLVDLFKAGQPGQASHGILGALAFSFRDDPATKVVLTAAGPRAGELVARAANKEGGDLSDYKDPFHEPAGRR